MKVIPLLIALGYSWMFSSYPQLLNDMIDFLGRPTWSLDRHRKTHASINHLFSIGSLEINL